MEVGFENPDARTAIVVANVDGLNLDNFKSAKPAPDVEILKLENVKNLTVHNSPGLKDRKVAAVENDHQ